MVSLCSFSSRPPTSLGGRNIYNTQSISATNYSLDIDNLSTNEVNWKKLAQVPRHMTLKKFWKVKLSWGCHHHYSIEFTPFSALSIWRAVLLGLGTSQASPAFCISAKIPRLLPRGQPSQVRMEVLEIFADFPFAAIRTRLRTCPSGLGTAGPAWGSTRPAQIKV